jgi:mRNA-degrading endonuclease RelE of RelBE toxin-antitoxin system
VSRIVFLGRSAVQRDNLPTTARSILEWALDRLEDDPSVPPSDPSRGCDTKPLEGPDRLFRIAIRPAADDPGYRAIYAIVDDDTVAFIRIVRRDASTYPSLRRALRLLRARTRKD